MVTIRKRTTTTPKPKTTARSAARSTKPKSSTAAKSTATKSTSRATTSKSSATAKVVAAASPAPATAPAENAAKSDVTMISRKELIEKVMAKGDMKRNEARKAIDAVAGAMLDALNDGSALKMTDGLKLRPARRVEKAGKTLLNLKAVLPNPKEDGPDTPLAEAAE